MKSFLFVLLMSAFSFYAVGQEPVLEVSDRGLVFASTPVPETAEDQRGDGVLRDETGRPVAHDLLGKLLFQFEAPLVQGGTFNSDSLRGKWTILVFWGVWCHDSRHDAKNIAEISRVFDGHPNIQFMSLHVPFNRDYADRRFGDYGSVENYFNDIGLFWPTALDEVGILRNWQQIRWTPTYLVIAPDMTIEAFRTDFYAADEGALDRFLIEVRALAEETY